MNKTIEHRAEEFATITLRRLHEGAFRGNKWPYLREMYIRIANEQKVIDDEKHRNDMRLVDFTRFVYNNKKENYLNKVLDATINVLEDHLIDYVLVGEDKESCSWGYRILGDRLKDDVKKRLSINTSKQ